MPWLRIHPKWNQLNRSLTYSPVTTLSTTDGWASMILLPYSDVRMVWMRRTHDYFNKFGCEDGLDDDPWFFRHIRMWGRRSGWRPMIFSTYSDVRMVWMRSTHDYFNKFGCEDGLDEEDSWFLGHIRMVWMRRTYDYFNIFRMWGWSGWQPMILFNIFGCEDGPLALPITQSMCYGQGKDRITKYHLSKNPHINKNRPIIIIIIIIT